MANDQGTTGFLGWIDERFRSLRCGESMLLNIMLRKTLM